MNEKSEQIQLSSLFIRNNTVSSAGPHATSCCCHFCCCCTPPPAAVAVSTSYISHPLPTPLSPSHDPSKFPSRSMWAPAPRDERRLAAHARRARAGSESGPGPPSRTNPNRPAVPAPPQWVGDGGRSVRTGSSGRRPAGGARGPSQAEKGPEPALARMGVPVGWGAEGGGVCREEDRRGVVARPGPARPEAPRAQLDPSPPHPRDHPSHNPPSPPPTPAVGGERTPSKLPHRTGWRLGPPATEGAQAERGGVGGGGGKGVGAPSVVRLTPSGRPPEARRQGGGGAEPGREGREGWAGAAARRAMRGEGGLGRSGRQAGDERGGLLSGSASYQVL